MKKDLDDFEKKLKLASYYLMLSSLFVAGIIFIIFNLTKVFDDIFGRISPFFGLFLGIYLIAGAIYWFRMKIKKLRES